MKVETRMINMLNECLLTLRDIGCLDQEGVKNISKILDFEIGRCKP